MMNAQKASNSTGRLQSTAIFCACLALLGFCHADQVGIRVLAPDKSKSVKLILDNDASGRFHSLEGQIEDENKKQIKERQNEIIPDKMHVIWSREESIGYVFRKDKRGKEHVVCFIGKSGQPLSLLKKNMKSNDLTVKFQILFVDLMRSKLNQMK